VLVKSSFGFSRFHSSDRRSDMSKGLQWVIGICVVLLTLSLVFSTVAPFFLPRMAVTITGAAPSLNQNQPRGFSFRGPGPMFSGPGRMFGGRSMMGGFGFPFLGGGLYLGVVILLVGLVLLGAMWFSRRHRAPVVEAPAMAPAAAAAPASTGVPAPAATTPCAHCGQPLQAEWKVCPYCGEKV
jgi:hypothetical protein